MSERTSFQGPAARATRIVPTGPSRALTTLAILAVLTALNSPATAAAPSPSSASASSPARAPTAAQVLEASPATDWRPLRPDDTLLMELPQGTVLIELAPRFAPRHAANIRALARQGYYDGLAIVRVQDNFVTQWGDPDADDPTKARALSGAERTLPAEFSVPLKDLRFTALPDVDGWAPVTGLLDGMPVAADPTRGIAWIPHCYGIVGAGRGDAVDSSTGAELYAVIGQSPRGLDLNITVVGRVLQGMQHLSALPRGGPNMGFYDQAEARTPIRRVRLLSQLPEADRPALEVLRTDSATWTALLEARRVRQEPWFVASPRHINVCNATVPMRPRAAATGPSAAPAASTPLR